MPSFLTDIFSPAGGLADLNGGVDAVYGSKPRVAPFVPVDLAAEQGKAVSTDLSAYPAITELLNKVIPGFSTSLDKGTLTAQNILDASNSVMRAGEPLLQGQIPEDVVNQIERSSAFKSLMGGFAGTPMNAGLTARDLGLTSLNLINQGANLEGQGAQIGAIGTNSAQQWANTAEQAYSPFFISTPQQAATTAANNAGQQATQQFKYNVAAAPDPGAQGMFNTNMAIFQQILGTVGGLMGGGGVGGGGSSIPPISSSAYAQPGPTWGSPTTYGYNPTNGNFTYGSTWGSDRRLKENIIPIGNGFYEFNYKGQPTRWRGRMAQEVPFAVENNGFLRVQERPRMVA